MTLFFHSLFRDKDDYETWHTLQINKARLQAAVSHFQKHEHQQSLDKLAMLANQKKSAAQD